MNNQLVSIIIATYNSEKTLSAALDSVLKQNYEFWECIIVDGASKDNTLNIINEYKQKDKRFSHISESDNGIYDAYNKGWKLAKGDWICYLGSDDKYLDNAIETLISVSDGFDVIYGDTILYYCNANKLKYQKSLPVNNNNTFCCHQSIMMRRTVLQELDGFDNNYKILADKDLVVKAVKSGFNFKLINEPISIFNVGGVSSVNFKSVFESFSIDKKNVSTIKATKRFIMNIIGKLYLRCYSNNIIASKLCSLYRKYDDRKTLI